MNGIGTIKIEMNMGALVLFGLVCAIATIGGLYFYLQEKRNRK